MFSSKWIILTTSIGLLLAAGHASVHAIAITVYALLALRASPKGAEEPKAPKDLALAAFAFVTALMLGAAIERSEVASELALPWPRRGGPLPFEHYLVSTACLAALYSAHRYWSTKSPDVVKSAGPVAAGPPPTPAGEAAATRATDPGSTDSDDLKFIVSSEAHPETAHNQPTHFMTPKLSSEGACLSYEVDPDEVLDQLVARSSPQQLLGSLSRARVRIPASMDLEAKADRSTAEWVDSLIAAGVLTKFQAMLICGGVPELIWIGDYEVLERIGRGGMAIVLRVRDRLTRHIYALKLLADSTSIDAVTRNRFLREMEAVRGLAHPNIAVARAVGEHNQSLYIAMEWVQGDNLAQYVHEHGPLSPAEAIDFIRQAADALQHAHQRGLIHRDIKPANLMLDRHHRIKLVDMGLARYIDALERKLDTQSQGWQTNTGHLMGTIDYMAPEQAMDLGLADQRSDIYSLGCTLFYLLTGISHLRGRTQRGRAVGLVRRTGMRDLVDVRQDLPECICALAGKMMSLAPERRFQNVAELMEAIDACAAQFGIPAQSGKSYRVLVVEDSPTQSQLTCDQLKAASRHFVPIDVPTLAIACERLQSGNVDLVILDLHLPDSSGISTIQRVRQVDATVPVLVLTGRNDPELGAQCIAAGADDFLPKEALEVSTLERHILLILSRRASAAV